MAESDEPRWAALDLVIISKSFFLEAEAIS
jgi:hypothetical protein